MQDVIDSRWFLAALASNLSGGIVRLTEATDVLGAMNYKSMTGIVMVLVGGDAVTRRQTSVRQQNILCGTLLVNILVTWLWFFVEK